MSIVDDIDDISHAVMLLEEDNGRLKRSVETYTDELEKLQTENKYLLDTIGKMNMEICSREESSIAQHIEIKTLRDELATLNKQPVIENRFVTNAQLQDITKLLDLLEPDITDKEQLILPEEGKIRQIIAAYREVRPL
jgi:regulator of replication initiation timing